MIMYKIDESALNPGLVVNAPLKIILSDLEELKALIAQLKPTNTGIELIRIGPEGDGGYLIPDDLDGIEFCFSPGVAQESGFEFDIAERGIKVFMADKSVDKPPLDHDNFAFEKKFLASYSDDGGGFTTIDDWRRRNIGDNQSDLILQMDIEGAEYEVIPGMSDDLLSKFRAIVVEFHNLDHLFLADKLAWMSKTFIKLLKYHSVAHIHPNNVWGFIDHKGIQIPRIMEFTFYRNDRFEPSADREKLEFPHLLDSDNVPSVASVTLPRCWQN